MTHKNIYPCLVSLVLLALLLLKGLQGLNLLDDGFMLSAYQQVFHDPQSVCYTFLYYLTVVAGGCWHEVFGAWGIFGFRLFDCLLVFTVVLVLFRLYRGLLHMWQLVASALMIFLLFNVEVFEYNALSAFTAILVVAFIMLAHERCQRKYMFAAGLMMALCIFVRLPNVALCGVALVCLWRGVWKAGRGVHYLAMFCIGVTIGVLAIWSMMHWVGHDVWFLKSLSIAAMISSSADNSHGLFLMLWVFVKTYAVVAFLMMAIIAAPVQLWRMQRLAQSQVSKRSRLLSPVCFAIATFLPLLLSIRWPLHTYNALAIVACCYVWWNNRNSSRKLALLAVLALLLMLLLPLGSDGSFNTIGASPLFAAIPLVFIAVKEAADLFEGSYRKVYNRLVITMFIWFGLMQVYHMLGPAYYEDQPRYKDVCFADVPKANVLTSMQQKEETEELMMLFAKHFKAGDRVLFLSPTPMLHYLTATRPYLYCAWPHIYGTQTLRTLLNERITVDGPPAAIVTNPMITDAEQEVFSSFMNGSMTFSKVETSTTGYEIFVPTVCSHSQNVD